MSTPVTPSANPLPGSTAEATPTLSEGERLINVFIAPSKTFTDLKRKASWFVPWLLLAVVSYAVIVVGVHKGGFWYATENQIRFEIKCQGRVAPMAGYTRRRGLVR